MQQMSIFDDILPRFKITKPIRLITLFSGIGAQEKALEILKVPFEHYKTCEWAFNSYCSYNAIHIKDKTDYAKDMTKEQLIEKVKGTSINYNEPLTDKQLAKKSVEWLKTAFNNIVATHNLVNIMNVKGEDLEIVDKDKYNYILTYSFPCQDLSLAGNRKGMSISQANGGTRSGLLWEVERILTELKSLSLSLSQNQMPDVLIMENVPEICSYKNVKDFEKWQTRLNELGYTNYCEILNGKDYGIPQNRKRCFMVSILGEYNYTFPSKIELNCFLKDIAEHNVDKKYYLSKKEIDRIANWKAQQKPLEQCEKTMRGGICPTLTARGAGEEHSGMILINEKYIPIKNNTEQGYLEAEVGDGVNISSRMHHQRGNVAKQSSMTLTTAGGQQVGIVEKDLRIRKLTENECGYLMGFEKKDCDAMREAGLSMNAMYHCFGDSLITTVMVGIFSNMINEINTHESIIADYVESLINDKI